MAGEEFEMSTTLLIDVSNMAHRAFYTTGSLSFGGDPTGVLYGLFRDIIEFRELFNADRIAFCFDGGWDKRIEVFPQYKSNRIAHRSELLPEDKELRRELRRQIYRLRNGLLNEAGFRNVFWQEGYEADDIIAWIAENHSHDFVIVSTDQDLFQCLVEDRVSMWNPITKRSTTQTSFELKYGVCPMQWSMVKAIAGCDGDGVPGIKGVGEKTAAKWIQGKLKPNSKAYEAIALASEHIKFNLQLVRLPFPGCGPFELNDDDVTKRSWDHVMNSLGMKSLIGRR